MSISTLRLSHVSDELECLNGILRGGSQALVGLDAWGYRGVLMYDAKSGDVEVEADCLPVDSILVPGYRALGGVMLGGGTGKVLRVLFPEVGYLDGRSPPESIPYSYPPQPP